MSVSKSVKLTVFPYEFVVKDTYTDDDSVAIHVWCLDKHSKPAFLRIEDFPAFCYVELPVIVNNTDFTWNKSRVKKLYDYFCFRLGKSDRNPKDHSPIGYKLEFRKKTYYYYNDDKHPMMMVKFKSLDAMRHFENILKYPLNTGKRFGTIKCQAWETKIPIVRKLLTNQGMSYSQWFTVNATPIEEFERKSTVKAEYKIDWRSISPINLEISEKFRIYPKILAFDIECYSDDKRVFPNQWHAKHVAYMISCIYQVYNNIESRRRYAIILGPCADIPKEKLKNTEIIHVLSEYELVQAFGDLVLKLDPEIVTGYNIFGFDYKYLDSRLTQRLNEWPVMGRIPEEKALMNKQEWSSGAYGHNVIYDLKMDGRINIDLLPIIKRDYKLLKYTLDYVSNYFLKAHKHDITAPDMFWIYEELRDSQIYFEKVCKPDSGIDPECRNILMELHNTLEEMLRPCLWQKKNDVFALYQNLRDFLNLYDNCKKGIIDLDTLNLFSSDILNFGKDIKSPKEYLDLKSIFRVLLDHACFFQKYKLDLYSILRYTVCNVLMTFVLMYCIQDSELVLDLIEKLNVVLGLIQMSTVCGVTIVELFTRGQQLRCMSLLYDIAVKQGFVIDSVAKPGYTYTGGFVYPPKRGLHENVMCWDFSSLYPTIIMAYNIDHTTLVHPSVEHLIPDEICNVIDFEQEEEVEIEIDDENDINPTLCPDSEKSKVNHSPSSQNESKSSKKTKTRTIIKKYRFKFLNADKTGKKGLIPQLEHKMVTERREVRAKGRECKDEVMKIVYHQRQLALKVVCNSFYGFLGVRNGGKMPLMEAAMSITGKARESIQKVSSYIEDTYNGVVVYGDSVTGDTPLIIQDKCGKIYLIPIEEINKSKWIYYRGKHYFKPYDIKVWSDKGFTSVKYVMRHKTRKRIYRIVTNSGLVKVTEDHSLIDSNGQIIKPNKLKLGDRVLTKNLPQIEYNEDCMISSYKLGMDLGNGIIDRIPDNILTSCLSCRKKFMKGYKDSKQINTSNISFAGLYFLSCSTFKHNKPIFPGTVIAIEDLGFIEDYVYDLETDNHHFSAGIGEIVVHNTDSVMAKMGISDHMEAVKEGKRLEKELTDLFPPPMNMELEKVMRILCLKKKRYVASLVDEKTGQLKLDREYLMFKGIELARRDRPKWLTDLQADVIDKIMHLEPFEDALELVINAIDELLEGRVDPKRLITVKGLNASYKSKTAQMAVFAESLKVLGKPAQPGSRLDFLVVKGEKGELLGNRMRLPETYEERKGTPEEEEIDYMYYIDQLTNPIGQLLTVAYMDVIPKLSDIRFRPTKRHGYVGFNDPIKMIYRMIYHGVDHHHLIGAVKYNLYEKVKLSYP